MLEQDFTEEEIHRAVISLGSYKAPGLDGFTAEFLKKSWNIIKSDILVLFQDFFKNGIINSALNETYISLIPEKVPRLSMTFVPSLIPLPSRMVSLRLKKVLPSTISEYQYAFVKGRQILDSSLIANEIVDEWQSLKFEGAVIKLDLEKAFDMVDWDFPDTVTLHKGFGIKWRKWIQACISTTSFSIIINGKPRGKFTATRGLRQGDPLPLFFSLWSLMFLVVCSLLEKAEVRSRV